MNDLLMENTFTYLKVRKVLFHISILQLLSRKREGFSGLKRLKRNPIFFKMKPNCNVLYFYITTH